MLPNPADFDWSNRRLRKEVINASASLNFKDGFVAKIINFYLKASVINSLKIEDPGVKFAHPPMNRILLWNLKAHGNVKFPKKL
jgi:hypothetical protein